MALGNIKDLLDEKGIPFLIVIFPALDYVGPSHQTVPVYGETYKHKVIVDSIENFATKKGIPYLDLYPFYEGVKIGKIRQETGHLNREGYLIAARAIAEYIIKHYKISSI